MTRHDAIAKAERKARRSERDYMITSRTEHPAYPGRVVYLVFPKADKYAWASDETLVLDTAASYAAGVAASSTLPAYMTISEMSAHCQRVSALKR